MVYDMLQCIILKGFDKRPALNLRTAEIKQRMAGVLCYPGK